MHLHPHTNHICVTVPCLILFLLRFSPEKRHHTGDKSSRETCQLAVQWLAVFPTMRGEGTSSVAEASFAAVLVLPVDDRPGAHQLLPCGEMVHGPGALKPTARGLNLF